MCKNYNWYSDILIQCQHYASFYDITEIFRKIQCYLFVPEVNSSRISFVSLPQIRVWHVSAKEESSQHLGQSEVYSQSSLITLFLWFCVPDEFHFHFPPKCGWLLEGCVRATFKNCFRNALCLCQDCYRTTTIETYIIFTNFLRLHLPHDYYIKLHMSFFISLE